MSAEAAAPTLRRKRRIERLRREIILLEHLDSRLWRKIALCAGVSVLLLGLMMFG